MERNSVSNAAFQTIAAHRILAEPEMSASSVSKFMSIRLTAICPDATPKIWIISFEQLGATLTKILGKATAAELLECLRVGQIMTFPGTYNTYEIAKLGYRKAFEPTAGLKRKAWRPIGFWS